MWPVCVEGQPNSIAIDPRLRCEYVHLSRNRHTGAFQRLAENLLLEFELRFVVSMLVLASAADAKMPARGRDPLRSRRLNLLGLSRRIASLVFNDANAALLAGQCQRHKDGLAVDTRKKRAAINRLFDLHQLCVRFGHC